MTEPEQAISAALQMFPRLTACGLLPTTPCGPLEVEEVAAAIEFLRSCEQSKKADRSSYGLKHDAEVCAGYVSNGALIAAAVYLQFKVQPVPGTPNAMINVRLTPEVKAAIARCREWRR